MREITPIQVQVYVTSRGTLPFNEWLNELDPRVRAKVRARIANVRAGNLGDLKRLKDAEGISELRIDSGPGYRIYFGRRGGELVILLSGSIKRDQKAAIKKATEYWLDYKAHNKN